MRTLTQKKIQTTKLGEFGQEASEFLHTVKNKFNIRYIIAAILLIASPFLMYLFKLVPDSNEWSVLGLNISIGDYYDAKVFAWTLTQKIIPVIAMTGIFFLFPASKNEKFISIYWLIFPLFSIYLYQTIWIFIDTVNADSYFTEFTVWLTIIVSIFSLALFRQFLIQREKQFENKLAGIQGVIQKLRDEEVYEIFASLYNIELVSDVMKHGNTDATQWRDKINDYALDGIKNVNKVLELLDDQKEEIEKMDYSKASISDTDLAY